MRILLTNDDGIHAEGLAALEAIAHALTDDVWVVAPEVEQSAMSRALTLHDPLRVRKVGEKKFAISGTPTDCAMLGIEELLKDHRPDLVLSGVNRGHNAAEDVTMSGTVAGAIQGMALGVPSMALSQALAVYHDDEVARYDTAVHYGPGIIERLLEQGWPKDVIININFPNRAPDAVTEVEVTRQGFRDLHNMRAEKRTDDDGESTIDQRGDGFRHVAHEDRLHLHVGADHRQHGGDAHHRGHAVEEAVIGAEHHAGARVRATQRVGAEELLQVVIGTRQALDLVAPEQPRPVAPRHLQEVGERLRGWVAKNGQSTATTRGQSLAELIAYGKRKPGSLNFASAGIGTTTHLGASFFATRTGIDIVHVPYKGAELMTDLLAGRVQMIVVPVAFVLQQIRDGKLLGLGITTKEPLRVPLEMPTVADTVSPGFEYSTYYGFVAPAKTPAATLAQLANAIRQVTEEPEVRERFVQQAFFGKHRSGTEFDAHIRADLERMGPVVKAAGATAN